MTALVALLVLAFTFALGYRVGVAHERRPHRALDLRTAGFIKRVERWRPDREHESERRRRARNP